MGQIYKRQADRHAERWHICLSPSYREGGGGSATIPPPTHTHGSGHSPDSVVGDGAGGGGVGVAPTNGNDPARLRITNERHYANCALYCTVQYRVCVYCPMSRLKITCCILRHYLNFFLSENIILNGHCSIIPVLTERCL